MLSGLGPIAHPSYLIGLQLLAMLRGVRTVCGIVLVPSWQAISTEVEDTPPDAIFSDVS